MGKRIIDYKIGDALGANHNILLQIESFPRNGHWYGTFLCGTCLKNTFVARITHVVRNETKYCRSCRKELRSGQNNHNFVDLLGQRFGKLVVEEYIGSICKGKDSKGKLLARSLWKCRCDCNRTREVDSNELVQGLVSSCGYCGMHSNGEYKVALILEENNISYQTQKTFPDCINPKTNHHLKFDFYLQEYNCCIEYDGISHYIPNKYGSWNTLENVTETRYRDSVKDAYCKENNILLIRIPYWDYNILDTDYLLDKLGRLKPYTG